MLHAIRNNNRIPLLLIAAGILAFSTLLGISAYLSDRDDYTASFQSASTSDISISVDGATLENTMIVHGESVELSPTITNTGVIPVYVFAEVETSSDELTPNLQDGWTPLDGVDNVYYYGVSELSELEPNLDTTVFDTVTLAAEPDQNVEATNETYSVTVTGYGIQADGYEDTPIADVWAAASSTVNQQ